VFSIENSVGTTETTTASACLANCALITCCITEHKTTVSFQVATMAAVLHSHSHSVPLIRNKRIRFAPSVNVDGLTQKQQLRKAALEIIMDTRHDEALEFLRGRSRALFLTVINPDGDDLPEGDEDGRVSKKRLEIRHFMGIFRGLGKTFDSLSPDESAVIDALAGMDEFSTVFKELLPSTVVSSTDTTPEHGQKPPTETPARISLLRLPRNRATPSPTSITF
jgi:hypothetical protein